MSKQSKNDYKLIIPVGTQVVTRVEIIAAAGDAGQSCPRGAVGEVVKAPSDGSHSYRVRFLNGVEVALRREDLSIRKQFQSDGLDALSATAPRAELYDHIIYRCVVGSRAYGLDDEASDTDRRGVYLAPAALHWSLYGVPEQLERKESEECYWELQKFLVLALKANPNVLECLYTPLVEYASPLAEELLEQRSIFLSRLVYQTYNGYVMSQFKKIEQDLRTKGVIKWKHAMHLVRLLLSGVETLREARVPVLVSEHRERLLSIRRGELEWEEVNAWRLSLHREFDAALERTPLPDRPDYERANALLLRARAASAAAATATGKERVE